MNGKHNLAIGSEPWKILPPLGLVSGTEVLYTQENPYFEGEFPYWIEGEAPDLRIMSVGTSGIYEVQKGSAWYPDAVYAHEQELMGVQPMPVRGNRHE